MPKFCRKILVTGGAGYIGSLAVALLLRQGFYVRVLDNLTFGGNGLLPYLTHPDFDFIHGDIRNDTDMDRALTDMDGVIHLAAIVGDPACRQNPETAHEVNKIAAESLCDKAIKRGIQRFVFASTCSNYGKMSDPDRFVTEETPLKPVSLYAELKVGFEGYLLARKQTNFVPVVLRFATAYGLSPRPRFDLTVNEFTKELVMNRTLEVYGEQFWRPYAHVSDLAASCIMALNAEPTDITGRAFNVGDNFENFQKKTLLEMILRELPDTANMISHVNRDEDPR
ncbi:MAG: SDR family oxidoreductase, partial [candidate division Zixibacteria bacterium]|nr:SDR family oxidoreductase [candidate division Zixibacteria bacterium]